MAINTKFVRPNSSINQYWAAFVVNLLTIGFGVSEAWSSPIVILITSDESPLKFGKITIEEASWIFSLISLGALLGNFFFGFLINRFGRKVCFNIVIIPIIISWLLVLIAQNVYYLYAARMINGIFTGAVFVIVPPFTSEIADDSVRGTLASMFTLFETIGMLLAYIIGGYCDFYAVPNLMIGETVVFGILLYFLPESPLFLVKQNKIQEAEKSIRFYKNIPESEEDHKLIEIEIRKLQNTIDDVHRENCDKGSITWSDILTGAGRKSIVIGIVLVMLCVCNGVFAMTVYSSSIFQETGSNLSPNMSTIVLGIIQCLASCVATHLVDRSGRKILLAVSGVGNSLGLIVLGVYMMVKSWSVDVESFNWIPLVSLSWTIFISSIGITALTTTCISEIMPEKIKDVCLSFCMTLLFTFSFLNILHLPVLIEVLSFHVTMYAFAGLCLVLTLYITFIHARNEWQKPPRNYEIAPMTRKLFDK